MVKIDGLRVSLKFTYEGVPEPDIVEIHLLAGVDRNGYQVISID